MKILVVDDQELVLRLVRTVLESRGHTVLVEEDGHRALEVLARDRVDLLISDVAMPTMRGPELAAIARRRHPELSILLMSGSERPDGYPFLAKPFRTQGILLAVQQAVARRADGEPGLSGSGRAAPATAVNATSAMPLPGAL